MPYGRIVLDERTQLAQYIDGVGTRVEATGHKHEGTTQTVQQTTPTGGGDGQSPYPPDDPKVTTYIPD